MKTIKKMIVTYKYPTLDDNYPLNLITPTILFHALTCYCDTALKLSVQITNNLNKKGVMNYSQLALIILL